MVGKQVKIIDNVYTYTKKNGESSYYLRVVNPRTGLRINEQLFVPEDQSSGKKLIRWLEQERNRRTNEINVSACTSDRRTRFDDYFNGTFSKKKRAEGIAEKTLYDYQRLYERHMKKDIGRIRLGDFHRDDAIQLYDYLQNEKGVGNATLLAVHRLLRSVLNSAVDDEIFERNVVSGRNISPKKKSREERVLSLEELVIVIGCADSEPLEWQTLYHLLVRTGCRRGELLALKWKDVNFKNQVININSSISYVPGNGLKEKETKTQSSIRSIPICDEDIDLLKRMNYACPIGYVFHGIDGPEKMMHPDSVTNHTRKFCKKYGIEHFSPHALRRSISTEMIIGMGVDPKTVQVILGHSNISTTLKHYTCPSSTSVRSDIGEFVKRTQYIDSKG